MEQSCYIGVVGSEIENGQCRDSIQNILRRPRDIGPRFIRATKGYEAREMHFNSWLNETDCALMLLLDSDMIFPQDTLEKLRARNLPYISGYYLRRRYSPVAPVWFEPPDKNGTLPFKMWTKVPQKGRLYELGASGWGCVLIRRDVPEAMRPILKGEPFVVEDDMDVWPYDLRSVIGGKEELIPLRGLKDPVGSDIRFPFFARVAGYKLYGDAGVECSHMLNYPLAPNDYASMPPQSLKAVRAVATKEHGAEKRRLRG